MSNLREIIKETLKTHLDKTLVLTEDVVISESLSYHITEKISLTDNIFNSYSQKYFDLINEVRKLWNEGKIDLNKEDKTLVESDLGIKVKIGKEYVYLDAPYTYETETEEDILKEEMYKGKKVDLNKFKRTPGGPKEFAVYVKTPDKGIKKVTFTNPKSSDNCDQKTDKTTAGYWSCSVGRYSKQLGLSKSNS
jgi:hypothetical protein